VTVEPRLREQEPKLNPAVSALVAVGAWIVPGLGHLVLRRWGRAIVFFGVTGGLVLAGNSMRGEVFPARFGDTFGILGFVADAGAGMFYFLARFLEAQAPDLSRAAGEYGSRFLAAAGIVNLLGVLDAYGIARARKS
jgi:hypothetical protein